MDNLKTDIIHNPYFDNVINSLKNDLRTQNWSFKSIDNKLFFIPPKYINKNEIKKNMMINRNSIIETNIVFIKENLPLLRKNLAHGHDSLNSSIKPIIEICTTKVQLNLFKMCRFYWTSPYSDYVGRRIKILVRDSALPNSPIIGIAALGSPLMQISNRDKHIGWTMSEKKINLNSTMDIYVLGAMPPYNELLGGKLISYILASREVREIVINKYSNVNSKIELACLFTTSLYGKSSIYNRLNFNDKKLYLPVGYTKGQGTSHISNNTFQLMVNLLIQEGKAQSSNIITGGPNWKFRIIRETCRLLNIDEDSLLTHNNKKEIYVIPLSTNYQDFLTGHNNKLDYYNFTLDELVQYWKKRWLVSRKKTITQDHILRNRILSFNPENFNIFENKKDI